MKVSFKENKTPKEHHFVILFKVPEKREDDECAILFICRNDPDKGKDSTSLKILLLVMVNALKKETPIHCSLQ